MVFKFKKNPISGIFWNFELLGSLGSPKRDPVRFGFLKTREPRVKFRVGFGSDPALALSEIKRLSLSEGKQYIVNTVCKEFNEEFFRFCQ